MKTKTKENLINGFKSLYSNDAVMETAKNTPWWIAVIIAVVATFIPVIPITVAASNQYGSSFLSNYTENMETYLTQSGLDLKASNTEFVVSNDRLAYEIDGVDQEQAELIPDSKLVEIYSYEATRDSKTQIDFKLFYTTANNSTKDEINIATIVSDYIENADLSYAVGTTTQKKDIAVEEQESHTYYFPSYILLSKYGIHAKIMRPDSTLAYSVPTSFGDWTHTDEGTKIIENSLAVFDDNGVAVTPSLNNQEYTKGVLENWKVYFDESYIATRDTNVTYSLLIYYGIYLLMLLFMGLMVFLLTRGKRNIFNYLKFGICLKMAAWSSITPAVLALILGFVLPAYAIMYFIVLLGIRVMWMSMKQLRPQY
jgi:maltodextrin utilization protein YvdJ